MPGIDDNNMRRIEFPIMIPYPGLSGAMINLAWDGESSMHSRWGHSSSAIRLFLSVGLKYIKGIIYCNYLGCQSKKEFILENILTAARFGSPSCFNWVSVPGTYIQRDILHQIQE